MCVNVAKKLPDGTVCIILLSWCSLLQENRKKKIIKLVGVAYGSCAVVIALVLVMLLGLSHGLVVR